MSSVPVSQRGISQMEYFSVAQKIQNGVLALIKRNFGLAQDNRNNRVFIANVQMETEDKDKLMTIIRKYNLGTKTLPYDETVVKKYKFELLENATKLMDNIIHISSLHLSGINLFSTLNKVEELTENIISLCHVISNNIKIIIEEINKTLLTKNSISVLLELITLEIEQIKKHRDKLFSKHIPKEYKSKYVIIPQQMEYITLIDKTTNEVKQIPYILDINCK